MRMDLPERFTSVLSMLSQWLQGRLFIQAMAFIRPRLSRTSTIASILVRRHKYEPSVLAHEVLPGPPEPYCSYGQRVSTIPRGNPIPPNGPADEATDLPRP